MRKQVAHAFGYFAAGFAAMVAWCFTGFNDLTFVLTAPTLDWRAFVIFMFMIGPTILAMVILEAYRSTARGLDPVPRIARGLSGFAGLLAGGRFGIGIWPGIS